MTALKIISKHYEKYIKDPLENLIIEELVDVFLWKFILTGPKDTPWEDLKFNGTIQFPVNFPFSPPVIQFTSNLYHPNIYPSGKVCISILHEGVDEYGYETANERWSPVQTIQTIFLSILSLFHDPNCDSPANVDAGILYRKDINEFKQFIRLL